MIAGLAACGQTTTTTPAVNTVAKAPAEILGFVAVTFTDTNTDHMTVSVKTSSVEDGIAGLRSQTLSRPAKISITQTSLRGASQDTPATHRWMFATLDVGNNSLNTYKNVTLLGVNIPSSVFLYDTSLTDAQNIDGSTASLAQAHMLAPSNPRYYDGLDVFGIPAGRADYQSYDEAYIGNIDAFMSGRYGPGATAFPYGFVARNKAAQLTSRDIGPGNTGKVTVSFATPDNTTTDAPKDIKNFTFLGLITADSDTTVSTDVYEADTARACAAAALLSPTATVNYFSGQGVPTGACVNPGNKPLTSVRIAGPGAGTANLTYPNPF